MIALAYIRLSGRDEREQVAPDVQRDAVQKLATENGWALELYDESETGLHSARKRTNLPAWRKLYERALSDPAVGAVLFYDLSRGWRSAEAFQREVAALTQKGLKVIFSVEGEVSFESADSQLIWGFRSNISEYESAKTTERLLHYHARLRRAGIYTGHRAPHGLTRRGHANDGTLRFKPNEDLPVVVQVLELYAAGYGVDSIARKLHARGCHWRNHRGEPTPIHATSLWSVLDHLEMFAGFVDAGLLRRVEVARAERKLDPETQARLRRPSLLLRRVLVCAECGARYTQSYHHAPNRSPRSYNHPNSHACPCRYHNYSARKVDAQVWQYLAPLNALRLEDLTSRRAEPQIDPHQDERLRADKVRAALERLPNLLAEGDVSPEEGRRLRAEYTAELAELESRLGTAQAPAPLFESDEELYDFCREVGGLVERLRQGAEVDPEQANLMMRLLFERITIARGRLCRFEVRESSGLKHILPAEV